MASDVPKNVANPSLYKKAKAKAKARFDVYPSAYANGWMVQEYKRMGGKYKGETGGEVTLDPVKSDLNKDGKLSGYERKRGTAIAKSMAKKMNMGGTVMVQGRGCGAIMPSKQKNTRGPVGKPQGGLKKWFGKGKGGNWVDIQRPKRAVALKSADESADPSVSTAYPQTCNDEQERDCFCGRRKRSKKQKLVASPPMSQLR